MDFYRVD